jgi:hypothetical protein
MVIQDYLVGKPRNQISKDRNTSTGNVSNIVEAWKKRTGITNVEELRDFVVFLRKSGMSISDCVQGFRIAQTMKSMGISIDGDDDGNHDGDGSVQNNYNDFHSFVEEVYLACKNWGIPPAIIPMWIKDLRDCYALDRTEQQPPSQNIVVHVQDEYDEHGDGEVGTHFALEEQMNSMADKNNVTNTHIQVYTQSPAKEVLGNYPKTKQPLAGDNSKIPLISSISNLVAKMREECSGLSKRKRSLTAETKNLKREKDRVQGSLNRTYEEEHSVTYYLEWFYNLKDELWERYCMRIEDVGDFAKVLNDFAVLGNDPFRILQEYAGWQSVKDETTAASGRLINLGKDEKELNGKIEAMKTQQVTLTQTMNEYSELKGMGLDLKELKQLVSTIMRVASANGIPNDKAADKFFMDIQEQYDNKIGFERKVEEKMTELTQTENKLAVSQGYMQLQPFIGQC